MAELQEKQLSGQDRQEVSSAKKDLLSQIMQADEVHIEQLTIRDEQLRQNPVV